MTASSPLLNSATAAFTQADVGKLAWVGRAGGTQNTVPNTQLDATVLSVQSATQCTLSVSAVGATGLTVPVAQLATLPGGRRTWRLAVRVEPDPPQSPSQSFSAGFELTGTPLAGELTLYTPLGSTVAALSWSAGTAVMRSNGDVRHFASLDALIKEAVGTEIPVAALFSWLAGESVTVAGWRADLSQHAEGRITARRTEPAPMAELRLVLEK